MESEKGVGERFERDDGRAVLPLYASENQDDDTRYSYLKKNLRPNARLRVTRSFFAISMERDGTIFYSRYYFAPVLWQRQARCPVQELTGPRRRTSRRRILGLVTVGSRRN